LDKVARALGIAARLEAEKVFFPRQCANLDEFEKELLCFPNGRHDDMVDAFAYIVSVIRIQSGNMPASARARHSGTDRKKRLECIYPGKNLW